MSSSAEPDAAPKRFPEWERAVRPPLPLPPPKAATARRTSSAIIAKISDAARRRLYPAGRELRGSLRRREDARLRALRDRAFDALRSRTTGSPSTCSKRCRTAATSASSPVSTTQPATRRSRSCTRSAACGVRFGFRHDLPRPLSFDTVTRTADRVARLGLASASAFPSRHADGECRAPADAPQTCRWSVDHLGYPDPALGAADPACRWLVDRLKHDPQLVGDALERQPALGDGEGWDDAIPIARAYIEAAPDRVIWGSRLAACAVAQAAHDERRRGGGAALPLRRQRPGADPENPGRQSGPAARVLTVGAGGPPSGRANSACPDGTGHPRGC